ncbi:MAG: 3-keto-disaccharide hydrolase [Bacteroidota bacterium]
MSFSIKSRYLFIILVAIFIVAGIFFLHHFILENKNSREINGPTPVGYEAEPDSLGWRPLFNGQTLAGWQVTNFGPQGAVRVDESEGKIILGMGDGCTGVTWQQEFPEENYEMVLDAMRVRGNDFFCGLTFPVRDEFCTLIVGGWGGTVVGISNIDGKDASENFTQRLMKFEKQQWYHIRVCVTDQTLQVWIDKKQVVDVNIKNHKFSVRPEVMLSRPLGICSWRTTAALKNIKFRPLDQITSEKSPVNNLE